eukprot:SAG25_NODE_451_length_7883_cov_4.820631_7_plen_60_part_00
MLAAAKTKSVYRQVGGMMPTVPLARGTSVTFTDTSGLCHPFKRMSQPSLPRAQHPTNLD